MDKQSMLNDYIDANGFKKIMTDEQLSMSLAVRLNLKKAAMYKRHQVEYGSHYENELLINESIKADQLRNYYVWNAIKVARFEAKLGADLINNYDDYIDHLIDKNGSISQSTLTELKILMTMESYRTMIIQNRKNILK